MRLPECLKRAIQHMLVPLGRTSITKSVSPSPTTDNSRSQLKQRSSCELLGSWVERLASNAKLPPECPEPKRIPLKNRWSLELKALKSHPLLAGIALVGCWLWQCPLLFTPTLLVLIGVGSVVHQVVQHPPRFLPSYHSMLPHACIWPAI